MFVFETDRLPLERTHLMEWLHLDPLDVFHRRNEPGNAVNVRRIVGCARHQREADPDRLGQRSQALREAQRRATAAGVRVDFRLGDVTRLGDIGLEPSYSLLHDFGCYHGLKSDERARYAEGVTPLAAPGASLYMMEFTHALPPIPSGVSESELRERFGQAWDLLWSKPSESGTPAMMRASAAWFCLKKR